MFCKHKVSLSEASFALKGFLLKDGHDCTAQIRSLSLWWAHQHLEDDEAFLLNTQTAQSLSRSKHTFGRSPIPLLLWTSLSSTKSWWFSSLFHRGIAKLRSVLFAKCFETIPWKLHINAKYYCCITSPMLSPRLWGSPHMCMSEGELFSPLLNCFNFLAWTNTHRLSCACRNCSTISLLLQAAWSPPTASKHPPAAGEQRGWADAANTGFGPTAEYNSTKPLYQTLQNTLCPQCEWSFPSKGWRSLCRAGISCCLRLPRVMHFPFLLSLSFYSGRWENRRAISHRHQKPSITL